MERARHILLLLVLIAGTASAQSQTTEREDFQAETLFEITTISNEHLLSLPWLVSTDSRGNIYVADRRALDIKLFNSKGEYVKTVGGSGRGPGEFLQFHAMHIDNEDRLVVADHLQTRITLFNENHEEENTYTYETDKITWPRKIIGFRDSLLIGYVLFIPPEQLGQQGVGFDVAHRNLMFHVMDRDLGPIRTEFGDLRTLEYPEEYPILETFRSRTAIELGSILAYDEQSVLFAHYLYNGVIHRMYVDGRVETHQGFSIYDEPFTVEMVGGEQDEVLLSESDGLFRLESGNFVHITRQGKEKKQVYIELFDDQLHLLRYGSLEGLEYEYFFIEDYSNGRFYGRAWSNEIPRVAVIEIDGLE